MHPVTPQPAPLASKTTMSTASELVGCVRRFGKRGVPYEVIAVASPKEVRIRVIPTGEETNYPIADVLTDPED